MKGCNSYEATIQLYLDNELSGPDMVDFRAHLEECEACRTELEVEKRLSALLHRSRPLYSAPDTLRARVMQTAKPFPLITTYAGVDHRKRITTVFVRRLQTVGHRDHSWGALVAAILLVAASLFLVPAILSRSSSNSFIETAVAAHRSSLDGNLPLEIQSGSPSVVTAWFTGKVPFTFRLPNSAEAAGHEQAYRLIGGRLVNYRDGHVALVTYQMHQQTISLLMVSSKSALAAGGDEVPSGGIVFHYSKRASYTIITWSNHGLTYALVSSMPGSGRQSCLVCHQNIGDGAHFSAHR